VAVAQPKAIVVDFVAFLTKVNAIALAIGVVVGIAVNDLVKAIVDAIINPLIGMIALDATGKGSYWVFALGTLVNGVLRFVSVMAILYVLSKVLLREAKKEPAA
jgi:large-conductance mechanosensitive channel